MARFTKGQRVICTIGSPNKYHMQKGTITEVHGSGLYVAFDFLDGEVRTGSNRHFNHIDIDTRNK